MADDLEPGDAVIWAHEIAKHGSVERLPGTLLVIRGELAKIEVRKIHGQPVTRWVKLVHLTRQVGDGGDTSAAGAL